MRNISRLLTTCLFCAGMCFTVPQVWANPTPVGGGETTTSNPTNEGLQNAINNGKGQVSEYLGNYTSQQLSGLAPENLSRAIETIGVNDLRNDLGDDKLQGLMEGLKDQATKDAAKLANNLLDRLPRQVASDLAQDLGASWFEDINQVIPTNFALDTVIDNGREAVENYLDRYDASDLAELNPEILSRAFGGVGVDRLTDSLGVDKVEGVLSGLKDQGTESAAQLAAGVLSGLPTNAASELADRLGSDYFEDLERKIPGAVAAVNELTGGALTAALGDQIEAALAGASSDVVAAARDALGGDVASLIDSIASGGGGIFGGGGSGLLGGGGGGVPESSALPTASAATMTTETCNPDIMVAMETRAWLEAQREVTQNANLIAKPDSVLEYTCFDSFLDVLALRAENMFSENVDVWAQDPAGISTTDMDGALQELIGAPMQTYIENNFSHSFVGGRSDLDNTMELPIEGAEYACEQMAAVWMSAKCMNFATRPEDGFLTFKQHASQEVRNLAGECGGSVKYPDYLALNDEPPWWDRFELSVKIPSEIFVEYTMPDCSDDRAIQTGLTIYDKGQDLPDMVCLNAGCYFRGEVRDSDGDIVVTGGCKPILTGGNRAPNVQTNPSAPAAPSAPPAPGAPSVPTLPSPPSTPPTPGAPSSPSVPAAPVAPSVP